MGVVTGTFQLPNGSPVANGIFQWKLSSDAVGTSACIAPVLFSGSLDTNGNMTSTFAFNDALTTSAGINTTYQLTIKASNGGQVWNENYYLTGTAANINTILPAGRGVSASPVAFGATGDWEFAGNQITLGTSGISIKALTATGAAIVLSTTASILGTTVTLTASGGSAILLSSVTSVNQPFILTGLVPTVAAGQLGIGFGTATAATAGTIVPPGSVAGYLVINLGGTDFKMPYYNN